MGRPTTHHHSRSGRSGWGTHYGGGGGHIGQESIHHHPDGTNIHGGNAGPCTHWEGNGMGGGAGGVDHPNEHEVGGRTYSDDKIAMLKGYCGILDTAQIPRIWYIFQTTKEITSHRHHLRTVMERWAKQTGHEIDKAPFFMETTVKDIVGMHFNPGEGVAHFSSAHQGISILTCQPRSAPDIELIKGEEEAVRAAVHTMSYSDFQKHQKQVPSPSPDTYFEL